ncbi:hypothetical protein [Massilia sp. PAMC28688]|nr:hypothetical protein [Massilia sp. PAMC28688]
MTWLTHGIAVLFGIWVGIAFALWAVDMAPDAISKILTHTPKG